jgi:hypothetical protein
VLGTLGCTASPPVSVSISLSSRISDSEGTSASTALEEGGDTAGSSSCRGISAKSASTSLSSFPPFSISGSISIISGTTSGATTSETSLGTMSASIGSVDGLGWRCSRSGVGSSTTSRFELSTCPFASLVPLICTSSSISTPSADTSCGRGADLGSAAPSSSCGVTVESGREWGTDSGVVGFELYGSALDYILSIPLQIPQ